MIEILTIQLKPGTGERFHQLYVAASLPIQRKWKLNVVSNGLSQHEPDVYYVVRRFKTLEDRLQLEDAFYNSDDWRNGPRTDILPMIESIATLVVDVETFEKWSTIIMH